MYGCKGCGVLVLVGKMACILKKNITPKYGSSDFDHRGIRAVSLWLAHAFLALFTKVYSYFFCTNTDKLC